MKPLLQSRVESIWLLARALKMGVLAWKSVTIRFGLGIDFPESMQKRGLPFWMTTTTGEATSEEEGCMTSNSLSLSTASRIICRLRGEVRYGCRDLISFGSASSKHDLHPTIPIEEGTTVAPSNTTINSPLNVDIQRAFDLDMVKLEGMKGSLPESIDPLNWKHEFRDSGPLLPQTEDHEDKQEGDLEWEEPPETDPASTTSLDGKVVRKHLKIFAGLLGETGYPQV